jgi:hypothetical protein
MHTSIINTTLLKLYYSDMFRPSMGHSQGIRLIYFNSKVKKMSYQMQNSGSQNKTYIQASLQ